MTKTNWCPEVGLGSGRFVLPPELEKMTAAGTGLVTVKIKDLFPNINVCFTYLQLPTATLKKKRKMYCLTFPSHIKHFLKSVF
jgi:hypothetical protein